MTTKHRDKQYFLGGMYFDVETGIAATGTTQGTATALTKTISLVDTGTVDTADGVRLPPAEEGKLFIIINLYGDDLAVWPSTGDAIDALSANAESAQVDGSIGLYFAVDNTTWHTLIK